ncbi:MAG TPA: NUDIX domain-containing protein [Patescibacteria group bacterium]|nr:NUDIX domain-containing protein [Patescibacteria group bacterium]
MNDQGLNIIRQTEIFNDDKERLVLEQFVSKDGTKTDCLLSYYRPFVVIVPLINRQKILMSEQFTLGTKSRTYGFFSEFMKQGENIFDTAKRILKEETGYKADKLIHVASLYEDAKRSRIPYHIIIAEILHENHKLTDSKIKDEKAINHVIYTSALLSSYILDRMKGALTIAVVPYILQYILRKK